MEHRDKIINALWHGFPNARWVCADTYATLDWCSDDIPKPTEQEFNDAITAWEAEYGSQEYSRDRSKSYPSVGDQLDMLMKDMRDSTTTHQTACEAVKNKFPKP